MRPTLVLLAICVLVGCHQALPQVEKRSLAPANVSRPLSTMDYDEVTVRVLQSADRVETFRMRDRRDPTADLRSSDPQNTDRYILGWPIVSKGSDSSADFAKQVGQALLDRRNFSLPDGSGSRGVVTCTYRPQMVFRLRAGCEYVDVGVDFTCGLTVERPGQYQGLFHPSAAGRSTFVAFAQNVFPDDAEKMIQYRESNEEPN